MPISFLSCMASTFCPLLYIFLNNSTVSINSLLSLIATFEIKASNWFATLKTGFGYVKELKCMTDLILESIIEMDTINLCSVSSHSSAGITILMMKIYDVFL